MDMSGVIKTYPNTDQEMVGVKIDKAKVPVDVIFHQFPLALESIARCSEYGHNKYKSQDFDWSNWLRVEDAEFRYAQALMRHRLERSKGFEYDVESNLPHLAHQTWNSVALLELYLRKK